MEQNNIGKTKEFLSFIFENAAYETYLELTEAEEKGYDIYPDYYLDTTLKKKLGEFKYTKAKPEILNYLKTMEMEGNIQFQNLLLLRGLYLS